MRILRFFSLALAVTTVMAVPALAQTTVFEDALTEPGSAFQETSGGDAAALVFSEGGMTVSAVNKGSALFLRPTTGATDDTLLNSAMEVDVTPGNKKTGVGLFCRRSEFTEGFTFFVFGKKWFLYGEGEEGLGSV